ncbi:MAG: thermonuclease family protein [Devosia sp.]
MARIGNPALRRVVGGLGGLVVILILAVLVALVDPMAPSIAGNATASDGDSFHMNGERIRLLGIDAPELDQTCTDRNGASWRCGEDARRMLSSLLGRGDTTCEPDGRDKYGRILAHCASARGDIGHQMVEAGLAVSFYEYKAEEETARRARNGVWQGKFERPQDWRQRYGFVTEFDLLSWLRGWWAELTGATKLR